MLRQDPGAPAPQGPAGYYFHARVAQEILTAGAAGQQQLDLSLDLNLSCPTWQIRDNSLVLRPDLVLALSELTVVAQSRDKVFCLVPGRPLCPVEVRSDGYYKLVPTDTAPTLEINGIKMHRSKDIPPLEDARLKTALVVRPKDIVLDTCGGLGYSAVFAVKAGAARVMSTEKNGSVLKIRAQNPWIMAGAMPWLTQSALTRIRLDHADITAMIQTLPDQSFGSVIHDPPRFSSATGDLYGKAFYAHLFRVMKNSGRLFHYTGSPSRIKAQDRFVANTMKRLEQAGFSRVRFEDRLQGVYAEKVRGPGKALF